MNRVNILFLALCGLAMLVIIRVNAYAQIQMPADVTVPEIHIDQSGKVSMHGVKVMQKANTTIFGRTTWNQSFIRWTVKTNQKTDIRRRYSDPMTVHEISEGDYLSVEGVIEGGSAVSILATKIYDWSDYNTKSSFSGTVKSIEETSKKFILEKDSGDQITVLLNATSTAYRNKREVPLSLIRAADKITSIQGTYNSASKSLLATTVKIYIDPNTFVPQNYQGILQSLPSTSKPHKFTLRAGAKNYQVIVNEDASILNNKRQVVNFDRFLIGDTVRVWGFIREDNDTLDTINASVVRNINF